MKQNLPSPLPDNLDQHKKPTPKHNLSEQHFLFTYFNDF